MNEDQPKFRYPLYGVVALVALVILSDFVLPGKRIDDEITRVQKVLQRHYNASRNYHHSFKVVTGQHTFSVSEDFAQSAQDQEKIEYSVSPLFKEVNWCRILPAGRRSFYSLRIMSGLALPLVAIMFILLAYRFKWNIDLLVYLLTPLLIADVVFLMG